MAVDMKKANKALDLRKLPFPPSLPVVELRCEEYTDTTGEETIRVNVILDESVDVEKVTGEEVGQLKSAIHDSLIHQSVTEFAYIFLAKRSELEQIDDDE